MQYMIARKKKKIGKYWTYMTDIKKEKFLKFSKKEVDKLVKELKQEHKLYNFKIVPVQK